MNYKEALDFIDSLYDLEKIVKPVYPQSLSGYRRYLKILGSPHKNIKTILVSGTKGKGSTSYLLSKIFIQNGYKTGLFISPHLINIRERIRINNEWISKKDFADIIGIISKNPLKTGGYRSVFETLTTLAFLYFKMKNTDIAVLEVGLGGRLDATNVVDPIVSIITDISYDHTHVLGKRLIDIAREKAGITRKGIPAISAKQSPIVRNSLIHSSKGKITFVGIDYPYRILSVSQKGTKFLFENEKWGTGLIGRHQAENTILAILGARLSGIKINKKKTKNALKNAHWEGRFQIISNEPSIVLDGAHNYKSTKVLVSTYKEVFPGVQPIIIFSCLKRKPYGKMLKELKTLSNDFIITEIGSRRAQLPEKILKKVTQLNVKGNLKKNINDAIDLALKKNKPILVTGSLYLIGEVLKFLKS